MLTRRAFLLLLLLFLTVSTTAGTRIPLTHTNSPTTRRHLATEPRVPVTTIILHSLYYVTLGVGTPPQSQPLFIDTGSNLLWFECEPCPETNSDCFPTPSLNPIFDRTISTSLVPVPCVGSDDPKAMFCSYENSLCCNDAAGVCTYDYRYFDGSNTQGTIALENVTVGDSVVPGVPVGCAIAANNFTTPANGILGLGGGYLSLASQSSGTLGGAFSYCLSRNGWLEFGRSNFSTDAQWTPMLHNLKHPSYYYIGLIGLAVDGVRVDGIDEMIFKMTDEGDGGVIVDTGTTVTTLPAEAYNKLRDAFKKAMGNVSTQPGSDTCYQLEGTERIPNITLFFSDGPRTSSLTNKRPLYGLDIYACLAFAAMESNKGQSVIGNIVQQGTRITIDKENEYFGFGPDRCDDW
ncbi:Protein ASPARTIC PROTEASE IN GUARD CELL 2 [Striga hermonthica]|uniref:Protein ASPARTIC PROTEASE IN GUARD CELL 2 n=1 Tax=Striga hermonthica TaxID=68872 RepID=A0A9N7NBB3_STRHE|nr:Protein ASPARTIC PROTEASE IN GUARD CELL 2 [Striga hermonthica]